MTVIHPTYACPDCEASGAQLYHFGRDNGHQFEVAHGCEHYIRDSYPNNPPSAEWLARQAVTPGAACESAS